MVLSDDELTRLEELCAEATPGPWFADSTDDCFCASFVVVSTVDPEKMPEKSGPPPWVAPEIIVASTLVQSPAWMVGVDDGRWDQNAALIAESRLAVPLLIAEVRSLRQQVAGH